MFASQVLFFMGYYVKKHLLGTLSSKDIFKKRLFRLMRKVPGDIVMESGVELLYNIKQVNGIPLKLWIRNDLSSDVQVMDQVFAGKEYLPLVEEIKERGQESNIKFIVDAGSNVGYVTSYLKAYFPDVSVIAIEPDKGNNTQAKKNFTLNNFKNITVLEGGLWYKDAWLEMRTDFGDGKEWSFYVVESTMPTSLKGFSFQSVLHESKHSTIDVLKIDIEGSEKELFEHGDLMGTVLRTTRFIAIEIHDETGSRAGIYDILKTHGFVWFNKGELTIATNTNLL